MPGRWAWRVLQLLLLANAAATQPDLDIVDATLVVILQGCKIYLEEDQAGLMACSQGAGLGTSSWQCPSACALFWQAMPTQCTGTIGQLYSGFADAQGRAVENPWAYYSKQCQGGTPGGAGATSPPPAGGGDFEVVEDGEGDAVQACTAYIHGAQGGVEEACMGSAGAPGLGTEGWLCPEACRSFWQAIPARCETVLGQTNTAFVDSQGQPLPAPWAYFTRLCDAGGSSGGTGGTGTLPPLDLGGPASPEPLPAEAVTGMASAFECNTSAGFQWITLNASLASMAEDSSGSSSVDSSSSSSDDSSQEVGGPEIALETVGCRELGTAQDPAGCCTQTPPAAAPWVEYGLGQPMVVQGVRLVAPEGGCCLGDAACTGGAEPCAERLLGTALYVTNSSVAEVQQSPAFKAVLQGMNASGAASDLSSVLAAFYSSQLARQGLCNAVTSYDLYLGDSGDPTQVGGGIVPNGTLAIGCGLGVLGGRGSVALTADLAASLGVGGLLPQTAGIGTPPAPAAQEGATSAGPQQGGATTAAVAVELPVGSWLLLSKQADDGTPLAFCGIEVCVRPAA